MLVFAALQINDPDPLIWIPFYVIVAFLGYRRLRFTDEPILFYMMALLYFVIALSYMPAAWEGVLLDEMGMKTMNIENARESLGLGMAAVILLTFGVTIRK